MTERSQSRAVALSTTLRHPLRSLVDLDARPGPPPWSCWVALTMVAVGGSLFYGMSLAWAFPSWRPAGAAAWMAASAGVAWCAFGPVLVALAGKPVATVAQACLVTMALGELILVAGAIGNALLAASGTFALAPMFNIACVATANLAMGLFLTISLRAVGVPSWRTATAWVFVLDGVGAALFWATRPWTGGTH